MAGGYQGDPGDPIQQLVERQKKSDRRLDELEKASTLRHLASLITVGVTGGHFNSGAQPGDSTWRWYDSTPVCAVTLNAPTGRVLITAGCGEASLAPGDNTASGNVSFAISTASGWAYAVNQKYARNYSALSRGLSCPLISMVPLDVPSDEPITVTAKFGVWSSSTGSLASVQFNTPYLNVTVIDPG